MPMAAPSDAQLRQTARESNDRYNAERRARGPDVRSTAAWQRLRLRILAQAPLCADPYRTHADARRAEPATQVDHIVGLHVRPELALDARNLQGLCTACHARKSADERKGVL